MQIVKNIHIEEVHQWTENGSHPDDNSEEFASGEFAGQKMEGQVVRYFRHPSIDGSITCVTCNHTFHDHGWIDKGENGIIVCPGDYIEGNETVGYNVIRQDSFKEHYTVIPNDDSLVFKKSFQDRVQNWLDFAFKNHFPHIINCPRERNHRFLEEALELVQACDLPELEAIELVKYVYSRPVGEIFQEVGGVSTTLNALCSTQGINLIEAAETELERDYRVVDKIRHKQGLKPTMINFSTSED